MPYNRKQRRAAAAAAAENENSFVDSSIPLSRPPEFTNKSNKNSNTRQAKTLLEIAAERQQELNQHINNEGKKKKKKN
ncbi:hypothetical protein F66182_14678, partial [Fusarium sp. NRRL 66182]